MQAYINSIGIISPQHTYDGSFLQAPLNESTGFFMTCIEPSYKDFINPVKLRRMSRILKMGLGASSICMNNLGDTEIDAIVVGTGYACIIDLVKFLESMVDENEQSLSPIPFINSSHNTVAGQIAMMKNIKGYNTTYCNRGNSFEYALTDALMLIREGEAENVLVGGIDEYSSHNYIMLDMENIWRKEAVSNLDLFNSYKPGTINGEGAGFFVLGKNESENSFARITGVRAFQGKKDQDISFVINEFLEKNDTGISEIDVVILGKNGDILTDEIYTDLEKNLFSEDTHIVYYKHLCGDYPTSSAFATWLSANILKTGTIPAAVTFRKGNSASFRKILIYNHFKNINHSLILLETKQK
jgi:3-oxoacyl-(acyl-carrier-protein) synthase